MEGWVVLKVDNIGYVEGKFRPTVTPMSMLCEPTLALYTTRSQRSAQKICTVYWLYTDAGSDMFSLSHRTGTLTNVGPTSQQCKIFWLVRPLYGVLQHLKIYLLQNYILWPGGGLSGLCAVGLLRNLTLRCYLLVCFLQGPLYPAVGGASRGLCRRRFRRFSSYFVTNWIPLQKRVCGGLCPNRLDMSRWFVFAMKVGESQRNGLWDLLLIGFPRFIEKGSIFVNPALITSYNKTS